jgi:hypothetical protein
MQWPPLDFNATLVLIDSVQMPGLLTVMLTAQETRC